MIRIVVFIRRPGEPEKRVLPCYRAALHMIKILKALKGIGIAPITTLDQAVLGREIGECLKAAFSGRLACHAAIDFIVHHIDAWAFASTMIASTCRLVTGSRRFRSLPRPHRRRWLC